MTVWHKLATMTDAERAKLPGHIRQCLALIERFLTVFFEEQQNE